MTSEDDRSYGIPDVQPVDRSVNDTQLSTASLFHRVRRLHHLGLLSALVLMSAFFALTAPNFLSVSNFTNILHQMSYLGIIACGMTLVIIAGEIDVSVGSATAFFGVILAFLLGFSLNPYIAIAVTLCLGVLIGLGAGALRAVFLIPSFIVTLGLFGVYRGLALLTTAAIPVAPPALREEPFVFLGRGSIFGIPFAAIALVCFFVIFWFIATRTTFGRMVYAVGGNPTAAHLAGIRVTRIRTVLFAITGVLAAVSGVLLASAISAGDPVTAQGLEFDVIAAVIVGGTNLYGGRGSLTGTFLGVLFIGILGNGLVLLGVNPYANQAVRGAVILLAVLFTSEGMRTQLASVRRRLGSPR